MASILVEGNQATCKETQARTVSNGQGTITVITDRQKGELFRYFSNNPDSVRFIERCMSVSSNTDDLVPTRSMILDKLVSYTMNENERLMTSKGFKTRRQVLEESFWFRMAYHAYREFGGIGCTFHPAVETVSGQFAIDCKDPSENPIFRFMVPRSMVKHMILSLNTILPNQHNMPIHPIPLKSIFNISMNTELDLEIRPLVRLMQEVGEDKFFDREDLERFRYDNLVYIPELGLMAELERPGRERKFKAPVKMVLKKSQVPAFLDEYNEELHNEANIIDPSVRTLRIIKHYDRIEMSPEAIDRDWCWLSVKYGFGNIQLNLKDILHAQKKGQRYIGTLYGWIDCQSPDLAIISESIKGGELKDGSNNIKFSRMDLFRLKATSRQSIEISGGDGIGKAVSTMLDLKSTQPFPRLKGLKSILRPYQTVGAEWIWFLYENRFGGLLCDDMGLGKTHQVMAFMLALQEYAFVEDPFMVICPTTVLSHWNEKIKEYAPSLKATIYYGGDRNLAETYKQGSLLVTSYGILLRDIHLLKSHPFSVVAFDEIQHIKNAETKAYQAAVNLKARMKIGLTGTPIENRLEELKALMDLTIPGYLGTDEAFKKRYSEPIQNFNDNNRQQELSRLISPFTLRRLKKSVLHELPEKIEDVMSCSLSDDQVKLYRDAISSRGLGILENLKKREEPIPYMHIFVLLNMLKQICDHPALLHKSIDRFEEYQSGKWDLFKELLIEGIGSDQKIVVYSQYLGMIRIMEKFLQQLGVGFVVLTGASRNRGELVHRFNHDPDCCVYVGSLKAGGVGVDLIAASIVIHYDRWWNAAKEDQATDRVHRIGQTRGVQVFKLATEGTLEEKISAIIQKKRNLMDSIVKEDDPGLLKTFTREELMEMLRY
jgi:hypothetical protein